MKKIISILLIASLLLTACTKEKQDEIANSDNNNENNLIHEHCTRLGNAGENIKVDLNYEIYYQDDILKKIESEEKITTENKETLEEYEAAYKKIHSYYKDLDNYITKLSRKKDSVTSNIIIEYDKIDVEKLLEIEGEEDNIFEDGIPKVSKWKELAEKFGTKCTKA